MFKRRVVFHSVMFEGKQRSTGLSFADELICINTTFRVDTDFGDVDFGGVVIFNNCHFEQRASFEKAIFAKRSLFVGCTFSQDLNFHNAWIQDSLMFRGAGATSGSVFQERANFTNLMILSGALLIFERVDLSRASFLWTNLQDSRFNDVMWATRKGRGACLIDEFQSGTSTQAEMPLNAVAENYRQLVLNYEARRDFRLAEEFHIGEMEMQLKESDATGRLNCYRIYKWLSNYGASKLSR